MSSKSSLRIVLVDPLGDVLFSGESLNAAAESSGPASEPVDAPDSSEAPTERCPETLRSPVSSASGEYPAAAPRIRRVAVQRRGRAA